MSFLTENIKDMTCEVTAFMTTKQKEMIIQKIIEIIEMLYSYKLNDMPENIREEIDDKFDLFTDNTFDELKIRQFNYWLNYRLFAYIIGEGEFFGTGEKKYRDFFCGEEAVAMLGDEMVSYCSSLKMKEDEEIEEEEAELLKAKELLRKAEEKADKSIAILKQVTAKALKKD